MSYIIENHKQHQNNIYESKPWLINYPDYAPAEIDVNQYSSIIDLFEESVKKFHTNIAFENLGVQMTFDELQEKSQAFATYLQSLGLKRGDRVALMMPNLLQYPVALFGVLKAGLVVVNVNPLYTPRELAHQLKDSGAKAIVILENFCHTLSQVLSDESLHQNALPLNHIITTEIGDLFPKFKGFLVNTVVRYVKKMIPAFSFNTKFKTINFKQVLNYGVNKENAKNFHGIDLVHEDLAFLQYTGGTTGVAKGAMLTHKNILANLLQGKSWLGHSLREGQEVIVTALPLYHIYSLTVNCLFFMEIGARNILITNPKDLKGFATILSKLDRFTVMSGVNTLFNHLCNQPKFISLNFSHLKMTLSGGTALQEVVAKKWEQVTHCSITEAYGLTECSPATHANIVGVGFNHKIGYPLPSTIAAIRDDEGVFVDVGVAGELCIKGPQVMRGYWERPADNNEIFKNGWLHTGDIAVMNEKGEFQITDRKKDLILVSGFNVYPNEVEDVAMTCEGVLEVAAVGVKSDKTDEAVKLVVVKKNPQDASLTAEVIIEHCRKNLTGYKVPKIVEFRTELPKTPVGKVLRRLLRD